VAAASAFLSRTLLMASAALACHATAALADPAIWRMTSERGGEITLLGSMHVLRPSDYPLPPAIDELIERADDIVMEIDLDDVDAATQQRVILGSALLPQGTALAGVVEADVYRLLQQRTAELGIDLRLLERFEPWFLAVTLLDQGMRKFGFEAERGLEQHVLGEAQRQAKDIVGLETLEFQIGIFDSLPPLQQQAMLEQTLAELGEAESALSAMVAAWRAGELERLSAELLDDFDAFPGLYDTLVTKRNAAWVPKLERMLTDGRHHLVVVGALHLVGPDNVISLLAARGHDVERVE
jgi:uncharacterized protein YbaP (TraB family)